MQTIQLKTMTRDLCHELYRHWTNDASIYMDTRLFQPYVYDEAEVNRYFDTKHQDASRRLFAIMLEDQVIGELQLKRINHDKRNIPYRLQSWITQVLYCFHPKYSLKTK